MNLSSTQMKLLVALVIAGGLTYKLISPYSEETTRIKTKASQLHKELDDLKRQAEVYGTKWEKEMKEKEQLISEQLPDVVNSAATLNYLLNQFEKANSATVHFLTASHQSSVATEFKLPGLKGSISPRVSRYKLHSRMRQDLVVPYLQHIEKFPPTHNLENMTISVPREGDPSLEIEVTVGVYLSPKDWVPKGKLVNEGSEEGESNSENWQHWFQDTPVKTDKKSSRAVASAIAEPTPKTIKFKISRIVGDGIIVNESLYEEGDNIQGWRILKVDGLRQEVTLKSGTLIKKVHPK